MPADPTLSDYLVVAEQHSPVLNSALLGWKADQEKSNYAGALPDPKFSYTYFAEPVETRVGPQQQRFGLSQSIPWFGTLGAKKIMAREQAGATGQKYQSERSRLFYEIKTAYSELYFLGRHLEITRENLRLLELWESVVRSRYQAGLSSHYSVNLIQVELGKLEDRLLSLEQQIGPVAARLRVAAGLPDSFKPPVPTTIEISEQTLNADSLYARIQDGNPDLKSAIHMLGKAKAGRRLAAKLARPNFTLGLDYIQTGDARFPDVRDSGKDPWMVRVGFSLPIWFGANKAREKEAAARQQQAEYGYRAARDRFRQLAETVVFEHDDALRKMRLYRDGLIPKARQSLEIGFLAYQNGEADFLILLETQRQLHEFQLQFERARVDLAVSRAAADMLAGL